MLKIESEFTNASLIKRQKYSNKIGLKLDFLTKEGGKVSKTLHIPKDIENPKRDISRQMKKLDFRLRKYHRSTPLSLISELRQHLASKRISLELKGTGKELYPWDITDWCILKDNY